MRHSRRVIDVQLATQSSVAAGDISYNIIYIVVLVFTRYRDNARFLFVQ